MEIGILDTTIIKSANVFPTQSAPAGSKTSRPVHQQQPTLAPLGPGSPQDSLAIVVQTSAGRPFFKKPNCETMVGWNIPR